MPLENVTPTEHQPVRKDPFKELVGEGSPLPEDLEADFRAKALAAPEPLPSADPGMPLPPIGTDQPGETTALAPTEEDMAAGDTSQEARPPDRPRATSRGGACPRLQGSLTLTYATYMGTRWRSSRRVHIVWSVAPGVKGTEPSEIPTGPSISRPADGCRWDGTCLPSRA